MEGTNLSFETEDKTNVLNQPEQQHNINTTVQRSHRLVYMAGFLESIKCKVDHDERYKLLHPNICSTVRKLKLNRKKTRRGNKSKCPTQDQV